jgi:hypothetical protein
MKKTVIFSVAAVFVFSIVFFAHALHQDVTVPYESLYFGEKSTMPMASAGDLRHHLISHMLYKKEYKLWPGKGKMYKGTEPHGSLLTTYVNDRAYESIKKKKGMVNNSIILKENYAPNKKLMAVTVMYKVKGYNPNDGDWFWVKYDRNFKVLSEGKVPDCLGCHRTVKNNDYLFTGKVR